MTLTKSEKKELQILYDQTKEIRDTTESKCIFVMRRLRLLMEKDNNEQGK